jgi:hypothetical protein
MNDNNQGIDDNEKNSNNLVNQLTLNFLISKGQLQKLNKKVIEIDKTDMYRQRIKELFNNLMNNEAPSDLLSDVRVAFGSFLNKSIYYFETHDRNKQLEKERITDADGDIKDDIDYDKDDGDDDDDDELLGEKIIEQLPLDYFTKLSLSNNK